MDGMSLQAQPVVTGARMAEDAIRTAILQGELLPGEELREGVIAERLGLSRTPIREALLALQAAGLLEAARGRSARVRRRTPEELQQAYELRAVVEAYSAGQAAKVMDREIIEALMLTCERFEQHLDDDDASSLVRENQLFHALIHDNSGNMRVPDVVKQLTEMPLVYSSYAWYSHERRLRSHEQHVSMTEAFDRRDSSAAEELMHEHILDAMRSAMKAIAAE